MHEWAGRTRWRGQCRPCRGSRSGGGRNAVWQGNQRRFSELIRRLGKNEGGRARQQGSPQEQYGWAKIKLLWTLDHASWGGGDRGTCAYWGIWLSSEFTWTRTCFVGIQGYPSWSWGGSPQDSITYFPLTLRSWRLHTSCGQRLCQSFFF